MMSNRIKVLVVDDNEQEKSQYASCLTEADMSVITACNSKEAVNKATDFQPDLILLDINIDSVGGFEVVKLLRRNEATSHIPIVFASSDKGIDNVRTSHFLGAVDFIEKPFEPQYIAKYIKELALIESISANLKKVKRLIEGM